MAHVRHKYQRINQHDDWDEKERINQLDSAIRKKITCSYSGKIFLDPVSLPCGRTMLTLERAYAEKLFGDRLSEDSYPTNQDIKKLVDTTLDAFPEEKNNQFKCDDGEKNLVASSEPVTLAVLPNVVTSSSVSSSLYVGSSLAVAANEQKKLPKDEKFCDSSLGVSTSQFGASLCLSSCCVGTCTCMGLLCCNAPPTIIEATVNWLLCMIPKFACNITVAGAAVTVAEYGIFCYRRCKSSGAPRNEVLELDVIAMPASDNERTISPR
jgi:hypothetical protein